MSAVRARKAEQVIRSIHLHRTSCRLQQLYYKYLIGAYSLHITSSSRRKHDNKQHLPLLRRPTTTTMSSTAAATTAPECGGPKTSWPEVVGLSVEEAKKVILKDKPDADIVVLPVGSIVTADFLPNRVRIFVDTVAQTPHVG